MTAFAVADFVVADAAAPPLPLFVRFGGMLFDFSERIFCSRVAVAVVKYKQQKKYNFSRFGISLSGHN